MTVNALKKQLMAAIAMVVVSAIALSSSTYAWFASNNKVTATTTKVQAQAEDGLEIALGPSITADNAFSTAATAEGATVKLLPTSTIDVTNWFHASAVDATASTAKDSTMEQIAPNATTGKVDEDQYFLLNQFTIRTTNGGANKDVLISKVEVTSGSIAANAIDNSLRVVVTDGTNIYFYKPTLTAGDENDNKHVEAVTGTGESKVVTRTKVVLWPTEPDEGAGKKILTGVNHDGKNVKIYVYYEGEDTTHYSNNILTAAEGLNVTVQFTGVDA